MRDVSCLFERCMSRDNESATSLSSPGMCSG